MLLSDGSLRTALDAGVIGIDPTPLHTSLQPASIDVHLGDELMLFTETVEVIDPQVHQPNLMFVKKIPEQGFSIMPGEFLLGTTLETISLNGEYAAELTGKSSLARLGLEVHSTAGFIDPGFSGKVTLEMKNVNKTPIRLRAGMPIGQFLFFELDLPCERPYGHLGLASRYQGQSTVTASRSWM